MNLPKETEQNIAQLQLLEQSAQQIIMQRQSFSAQLNEIENALNELKTTKEKPFKIVGNLMVQSSKEELEKDLKEKKEMIGLRVKNYESQEEKIKKRITELQKSIMGAIEKGGEKK